MKTILSILPFILFFTGCVNEDLVKPIESTEQTQEILQPSITIEIESPTSNQIQEVPSIINEQTSNCDPNYSGCVPIASDVDCSGGSGNGPAYVDGPVIVIGRDIYGLDRDGDGYGCE